MQSGESNHGWLFPSNAAGLNRRTTLWRRLVAAIVVVAFATTLVSLGFHRYAHHAANGVIHSVA